MGAAQQKICNGGYLPHQIINLDETAINWGAIQKRSICITHKFKTSIKESFQATGCAPKGHNAYQQYSASSNKGNLQIIPSGTIEKKAFSNDEFLVDMVNLIDNNDDEDTDEE